MPEFKEFLKEKQACKRVYKHAKEIGFNFDRIWAECHRGDDLLWLLAHGIGRPGWPTHKQVVLLTCDCAERALKFLPKKEDRPRKAIETVRKWTNGEATLSQVMDAANAADIATAAAALASAWQANYVAAAHIAAAHAANAAASTARAAGTVDLRLPAAAANSAAAATQMPDAEYKWQANYIRNQIGQLIWEENV